MSIKGDDFVENTVRAVEMSVTTSTNLHQPARHPPCSVPWPNCFLLHSVRTRSYLVGRSDRTDLSVWSPSSLVPDLPERPVARTFLLKTKRKRWKFDTHSCKKASLQEYMGQKPLEIAKEIDPL